MMAHDENVILLLCWIGVTWSMLVGFMLGMWYGRGFSKKPKAVPSDFEIDYKIAEER